MRREAHFWSAGAVPESSLKRDSHGLSRLKRANFPARPVGDPWMHLFATARSAVGRSGDLSRFSHGTMKKEDSSFG